MRELKFRIWIKDEERYYDELDEESYLIMPNGNVIYTSEVYEQNDEWFRDTVNATNEVIIEQYTGLKDKNGKEIYEGDIVRYTIWLSGAAKKLSCTIVVKWWSGEEEYYPCCTTSGFSLPYSEDGYEVIGNIHENPELLGGKE